MLFEGLNRRMGGAALIVSLGLAGAAKAENTIPIFKDTGGELTSEHSSATANEIALTFGYLHVPDFIVFKGKAVLPVYGITPEEYEQARGGDGVINGPDTPEAELEFKESEGTDTRDDLVFDESEGLNVRDDMTFDESEGTNVQEGATPAPPGSTPSPGKSANARPGVIDLDTVAAEKGPIELFEDDEIGAINPADGNWILGFDDVKATGCPPGVEAAAVGSLGLSRTFAVTFTKPWWQPSDLSPSFAQFSWRPVGANGYFSTVYDTSDDPEMAGSGMSLATTLALTAKSESLIAYWGRVNVNLAPHLAAIAGGSTKCRAIVMGTFKRSG